MNLICQPSFLLTIPAEPGTLVLALLFGAMTTVFTLRLERRDK